MTIGSLWRFDDVIGMVVVGVVCESESWTSNFDHVVVINSSKLDFLFFFVFWSFIWKISYFPLLKFREKGELLVRERVILWRNIWSLEVIF